MFRLVLRDPKTGEIVRCLPPITEPALDLDAIITLSEQVRAEDPESTQEWTINPADTEFDPAFKEGKP